MTTLFPSQVWTKTDCQLWNPQHSQPGIPIFNLPVQKPVQLPDKSQRQYYATSLCESIELKFCHGFPLKAPRNQLRCALRYLK